MQENNHFTERCSGSEAGSCLRLIDSYITQLKAQGPSRTCDESKEEEEACHAGASSKSDSGVEALLNKAAKKDAPRPSLCQPGLGDMEHGLALLLLYYSQA